MIQGPGTLPPIASGGSRCPHHAAGHGARVSRVLDSGMMPLVLSRPTVGLRPTSELFRKGERMGLKVSAPRWPSWQIRRHGRRCRAGASGVVDPASVSIERLTATAGAVGPACKQVVAHSLSWFLPRMMPPCAASDPLNDFGIGHHVVLQQPGTCRGGHSVTFTLSLTRIGIP